MIQRIQDTKYSWSQEKTLLYRELLSLALCLFPGLVNQWSLEPVQPQQESPAWYAGKKETTLCKRLSCATAQWCYTTAGRQPSGKAALLWSGPLHTAQIPWDIFGCVCFQQSVFSILTSIETSSSYSQGEIVSASAPAWEWQQSASIGKGKRTLQARGELTYTDRSPCSWSLIGLSSFKWGLQVFTVWLVHKTLSWLVGVDPLWLVSGMLMGTPPPQYSCLSLIG